MADTRAQVSPQPTVKYTAMPLAVLRSGLYFSPPYFHRRRSHHQRSGIPTPKLSPRSIAAVVADELVLAGFKIMRNPPSQQAWDRIAAETSDSMSRFESLGMFAEPRRFHQEPAPISPTTVRAPAAQSLGLPWQQLRWDSDWSPLPGSPGAERWGAYEGNRRGSAWILRHGDHRPRHWAVVIHGTEQGRLIVDQIVFRAKWLFEDLGCNVVMPLMPLHGARRDHLGNSTGFPTLDVMDNVHGLAQGAYDVRALLGWIRRQSPRSISLTGLSLGGYVAALVAGLEPELGAVVGLVPAVDFPNVFERQTPHLMRGEEHIKELASGSIQLHSLVSPLQFQPATPPERLFIVAGLHDRLLDPRFHALRLAEHWNTTNVKWLERGHVTHMLAPQFEEVLETAIERADLSR